MFSCASPCGGALRQETFKRTISVQAERQQDQQHSPDTVDAADIARAAGLRYVSDHQPGIRREQSGDEFAYIGVDGKSIDNPKVLDRIKGLGIPPAWTDIWISPLANGHIQATGRDAKGRKQYRYHPHWREVRDENKYERMIAFAEALPKIRGQVTRDLARHGLPREKVLATVVALLDATHIRIGNQEYARENDSYGLTTMQHEHVDVHGNRVHFEFRGKSGKDHSVDVRDRRLARIVKQCEELPGHELFQYLDDDGQRHAIESNDVNEYLHRASEDHFTAKDFRTWAGTVVAAGALQAVGAFESQTQAKHNIVEAVKAAAQHLGNTPAICRRCYVHPGVLEAYLSGSLLEPEARNAPVPAPPEHGLRPEEASVLALLHRIEAAARQDDGKKQGAA